MVVNATGLLLEICYLTYYYSYTGISSRRTVTKQIFAFYSVFSVVFYGATYVSSAPLLAIGYVGSCTAMGVYAAPLATVAKVIRLRSSEYMSFPLSAVGLVVAIEWFLCEFLPNCLLEIPFSSIYYDVKYILFCYSRWYDYRGSVHLRPQRHRSRARRLPDGAFRQVSVQVERFDQIKPAHLNSSFG